MKVWALAQRLDLDFSQEGDRFKARREIADLIEIWVASQKINDIDSDFTAHGVYWSRYQSVKGMLDNNPNCSALNPMFERLAQPDVGSMLMAGSPLEFEQVDRQAVAVAPRLGEHTDQVLCELLGLGDGEIGRLHDQGVVGG